MAVQGNPRSNELPDLLSEGGPRRAHLVGIAGAGMRAMAGVLYGWGWKLSGSDSGVTSGETLGLPGVKVSTSHAAENVAEGTDLVIHSDALGGDNEELQRAAKLGIPVATYFQVAGCLMRWFNGIAVAGTHGKSTTTAMAARVLIDAGLDPTVLCGAHELGNTDGEIAGGGRSGGGKLMLVEACEYRQNFLHLQPRCAAILGIEADHFDCYEKMDDIRRAFELFAASVPSDGFLIVKHDCFSTRSVVSEATCKVETFGFKVSGSVTQPDWMARLIDSQLGRYRFEILHCGIGIGEIALKLPGRHNVLNALATAALAFHQGVDAERIASSLSEFRGLNRRLELLGTWHGVTILDDYAHHPTEVAVTLQAIREMYPGRRLCCVFQPHQASRTARLLDELAEGLENVDCLVLAEIFRAREGPPRPGQVTAEDLADAIRRRGQYVSDSRSANEIHKELINNLRPGDVLVTIGAGDIRRIANGYIHWIREDRAA
ncbi:MAG: UDP-N-acetylmuramate--L-alanine ligase [Pirellulales bacterium]|nr:UDP-N-acetylmuramate--L-alanine ligase [Pirellulales bacterium]